MDRLSHRDFGSRGYVCVHCTLQPGALRTLLSSMLSEGSVILLSRHDASPATRLEPFCPGWSLTHRSMCPFLDPPPSPRDNKARSCWCSSRRSDLLDPTTAYVLAVLFVATLVRST